MNGIPDEELPALKKLLLELYQKAATEPRLRRPAIELVRLLNAGADALYKPVPRVDTDARTVVRLRPKPPAKEPDEVSDEKCRIMSRADLERMAEEHRKSSAAQEVPDEPPVPPRFNRVMDGRGVNAVIDTETGAIVTAPDGQRFPTEVVAQIEGELEKGKAPRDILAALYPPAPAPRMRVMGQNTVSRMMRVTPPGHVWCSGKFRPEEELRRNLAWQVFSKVAGQALGLPTGVHGFESYLGKIPRIGEDWPAGWNERFQLVALVDPRVSIELVAEALEVENYTALEEWEDLDQKRRGSDPYWIRCQLGRDRPPGGLRDVRADIPEDEIGIFPLEALMVYAQYGEAVFTGLPRGFLCDGNPEWPVTLCLDGGQLYLENALGEEALVPATRGTRLDLPVLH